ncbi:MAG: trypsin-like peptidase domain-containing protein [Acidobacteriota bacterium]
MKLIEKMRRQKLTSSLLVLCTLAVGILIGTVITTQWGQASAQSGAIDATPLTVPPITTIGNEFTQLAKKLEMSVVAIQVEIPASAAGAGEQQGAEGDIPEFFRRFLPEGGEAPGPREQAEAPPRTASGTGFIVDKNGYILTNNHVVENALKISVKLHGDSNDYKAHVIGTDYETDLAVIKIDVRKTLQPVSIANSDSVQVGDWAVAIGSPFGLEATVTAGIVSATGRGADQIGGEVRAFQNFIQTDAAINPGNSGGPLLNIKGDVIGVNTMIATRTGGSEGVGFALPINMGVRVYNDIIKDGHVTRGSVGVGLANATRYDTMLKALGVDHGAVIETIRAGGPAAEGGIKSGDIIVAINGKPVKDNQDLIARVADLPVGKQAAFSVDRDRKMMDLRVLIQNRAEMYKDDPRIVGSSRQQDAVPGRTAKSSEIQFGFRVRGAITEQERSMVASGHGIAIASVVMDSFAEDVGLEDNDIIDAINRQPVNSIDDINKVRGTLKAGDAVTFHVIRPVPGFGGANGRGKSRAAAVPQSVTLYLAGTLPEN